MTNKNIQPAIKSYFFQKGYKDLANTIMDSWKMNLKSGSGYWRNAARFWNDGGFSILKAIAMAFAALSVIVFGTIWFVFLSIFHVFILVLFFSIIYISFSFLWIAERTYMIGHGIFVVCPYCHEKFDLPIYRCPNCNVDHSHLIPSSYGIWKRTCLCGHKLPTTFYNGRAKLEAKCPNPNCSRTIETTETKPICIPIIGGPSVGKTCYLFAATNQLIEKIAPKESWKINFLNDQNEMVYKRVLQNFKQSIVPAKTVEFNPNAFNFFIGSDKWNPEKTMYFYDSAGEVFQDSDNLISHKFYGFLNGFIFIIDPFSIPQLLVEYEDNLKLYSTDIKPSDFMIEDCFDTMIINLEKNHNIKKNQQVNKPCAIILNKVDAFDLEDRIGYNAAKKLMMKDPSIKSIEQASHMICEELFNEWELSNFLRNLKQKFKNYRFFTCSALGDISKKTPKKQFAPYRVTEPLMWLLSQVDKDFRIH